MVTQPVLSSVELSRPGTSNRPDILPSVDANERGYQTRSVKARHVLLYTTVTHSAHRQEPSQCSWERTLNDLYGCESRRSTIALGQTDRCVSRKTRYRCLPFGVLADFETRSCSSHCHSQDFASIAKHLP